MTRHSARNLRIASLESLEDRITLSTTPANPLESLVDTKGGPVLGIIYTEYVDYVQSGSKGAFNSNESPEVEMVGSTVGVDISFGSGNFLTNAAQLEDLGLVVTASNPSTGLVEGLMPIGQLPSVASDPNLSSLAPVFKPTKVLVPSISPAVPSGPTNAATTSTPSPLDSIVALKGGPALGSIYQEYVNYEQAGGQGRFSPVEAGQIEFSGTSVGVDIRTSAADFSTMLTEMKALGMQVTATDAQVGVIEGFMPIAQLPTVATNGLLAGMNPVYKPTTY